MKIQSLFFLVLLAVVAFFAGCENNSNSSAAIDGDLDREAETIETDELDIETFDIEIFDIEMFDTELAESELTAGDNDGEAESTNWLELVIAGYEELSPKLCYLPENENLLGFDYAYTIIKSTNPVQYKNFYLLTIFDEVTEINSILAADNMLNTIASDKLQALSVANASCETKECFYDAVSLNDDDLQNVKTKLADFLLDDSKFIDDLASHIRPSAAFILHAQLTDANLLETIIVEQFATLQIALKKYGNDLEFTAFKALFAKLETDIALSELFYKPMLEAAIQVMLSVSRDEAGRYEPMEIGENKAAFEQLDKINWNNYPFTLILVPGLGPDSLDVALHPGGAERCDMAAARLDAGLAPLIAVSGGHVHPDQTPYSEAIEMKKYLMNTYQIDESKILIDPHARHTTTNLRNVARLLYQYGIPTNRPYMTTTDMFQSIYISNLDQRCLDELYYVPYRIVEKMTATDNCIMPSIGSMYLDPRDLLDP